MGLFDLDEYKAKKARADESATPARAFPVVFAEVTFDGRRQKLRFEPMLLDGGKVFISFRPANADVKRTLIVGKQWSSSWKERLYVGQAQQGLDVATEKAFEPSGWLPDAVQNIEDGFFGRLTVEKIEVRDDYFYSFYGSGGTIDWEDYAFYTDTTMWRFSAEKKADFDPYPDCHYWARSGEARAILIRLDADEFAAYLERQKASRNSVYGLSLRWGKVQLKTKEKMVPPIERKVEAQVSALMRAVMWSDPTLGRGGVIAERRTFQGKLMTPQAPLWRRPRFFSEPNSGVGETFNFAKQFERRIAAIWPHVAAHFVLLFKDVDRSRVHPAALHWMSYRGGYIVEFAELPNFHEHLEARLLLRDFLAEQGVSLDDIDAELRKSES